MQRVYGRYLRPYINNTVKKGQEAEPGLFVLVNEDLAAFGGHVLQ
jgi:hypothetical protein